MPTFLVRRTLDQYQTVEAANEQDATDAALARPNTWEHGDETFEVEPTATAADANDLRARVAFHPQAWIRDEATDVDPEGDTTFEVSYEHLEQYGEDALTYELEPYVGLPQLPDWIREWRAPFRFEITDDPQSAHLTLEGKGMYRRESWSIQNPHAMCESDPDRSWYARDEAEGETLGPFDTLDEVRAYLARRESIDEWRADVCMALREAGQVGLADEFASVSTQQAMTYRDTHEAPEDAAAFLARESETA